jgi:hypothetical protein
MNPLAICAIIFGCVFGGAQLGMALRAYLPEGHASSDSREAIRLGMGLVATTVALVLGLLIASAKGFYDTQNTEMTEVAANVVLLDRVLAHYGPEANDSRAVLRTTVASLVERAWQHSGQGKKRFDPAVSGGEVIWEKIQELKPANENQQSLRTQALGLAIQLGRLRWLMFEQKSSALPPAVAGDPGCLAHLALYQLRAVHPSQLDGGAQPACLVARRL